MLAPPHSGGNNLGDAAAWAARAEELAEWVLRRLANRVDVWGAYNPLHLRDQKYKARDGTERAFGKTYTAPRYARDRGRLLLTHEVLRGHFRATAPEHVIGVHTTSRENKSLWGATEIDWHGPESTAPMINLAAAIGWRAKLAALGLHPLLTDSNGKGGFHLHTLFAAPVPTANVFAFLQWLVNDHARYGLPAAPETYPKQPRVTAKNPYGNWLRLPGRHHTREHWSRVWDGSRWLEGGAAIDFILSLTGDSFDLIPVEAQSSRPAAALPRRRAVPRRIIVSAGGDLPSRIRRYMAKLPNLCEGQGRDDVAYNFAAFLVRDLGLSDADALPWLNQWDAGNSPPKGEARLKEIMRNAHTYGQRDYGSGLRPAIKGRRNRIRFAVEI
jgi:hypothetical protein